MFDFFGIFIFEVLNIGTFTQENFILGIFVFLTFLILIVNYFYDKKLSEKDERVVNIKQESVFDNIKAKEKIVKKIINYAHYFNGIEYEKSQKDYSVLNVNIKINKDEMIKFTKIQNSVIEVTPFYVNLIGYLNSKSENFGFKKIEQIQIDDLKKIKELKYLILNKFTVMKQKHYFASISQLYQVASNIDEMEFLSFLNDFPHGKYSSLSLRHAIFYVKEK
ncbi:hypothetical protein [Arcobacter sp.]|uniref:hypothetical protein n=1 Tax=Arcobacter sp. TaxID=1872629 RepID=UPI003D113064